MTDSILYWNQVALDAAKADFSSPDPAIGPQPQHPGPTYVARALAIMHLAMHDAYFGITKGPGAGKTYLNYGAATPATPASAQGAVAAAACLTLTAMFSRQREAFLKKQQEFLLLLPDHDFALANGLAWGALVAAQILEDRAHDGADLPNDQYAPSTDPFRHRPDPLTPGQAFLGPRWGEVRAFGFHNLRESVTPPEDPTTLPAYIDDYLEVLGKGRAEGSTRTLDETTIGLFWAYDGARNIGLPPRLYNQVIRAIGAQKGGVTEEQNAKLFAMVNVAMADAGIQAWYEKYKHNLWRPIVGIREADTGWGPTGRGDGKPGTVGDPYWVPLGAPRTNSSGAPSLTPPFPAYPSGHATFGTAALLVTQYFLKMDEDFEFKFVSDELNGENIGATGIRPRHERTLTIPQAIHENLFSRVYLGVHWRLDGISGKQIGKEIAEKIVVAFPAKA
jgi:vanadium chloroperoxidase